MYQSMPDGQVNLIVFGLAVMAVLFGILTTIFSGTYVRLSEYGLEIVPARITIQWSDVENAHAKHEHVCDPDYGYAVVIALKFKVPIKDIPNVGIIRNRDECNEGGVRAMECVLDWPSKSPKSINRILESFLESNRSRDRTGVDSRKSLSEKEL